jgi:hypothetical protein
MKTFFMGLWLVVFTGLVTSLCWSQSQESDSMLFQLATKEKPLREVLDQLGRLAGYSIEIAANWENIPVTVPSNKIKFKASIKAVLKSAGIKNYAIIENEIPKKLTIYVFGASASSGNQDSPVKNIREKIDEIEGRTFSWNEIPAEPPEHMLAENQKAGMPVRDEEPVAPPPWELLKEGELVNSVSDDGKPIASPPEDMIDPNHGAATASNQRAVAPPSENIIRQYHDGESIHGENKMIPPPPKEILMRPRINAR